LWLKLKRLVTVPNVPNPFPIFLKIFKECPITFSIIPDFFWDTNVNVTQVIRVNAGKSAEYMHWQGTELEKNP